MTDPQGERLGARPRSPLGDFWRRFMRNRLALAGLRGVRVLVVNAGSSSLKLTRLGDDGAVTAHTTVEAWEGAGELEPVRDFLGGCGPVDAVGHRVVHGGARYTGPVRIDPAVTDYLESISRINTSSTQPPRKPEIMPIRPPMSVAEPTARKATISATRLP